MSLRTLQTRIITQGPPGAPPPPPGGGLISIVASFTSWDVNDSTAPVQVGSAVLVSANTAAVILGGTTIVWACSAGNGINVLRELTAVDITNQATPAVLGTVDLGNGNTRLSSLAILGTTLYLASDGFASESRFYVVDGSVPSAPASIAVYNLNSGFAQAQLGPTNIVASGSHAFILSSAGFTTGKKRWIASYDVSNPLAVTQSNALTLQTVSNPGNISPSGGFSMQLGGTVAWCLLQGRTNATACRLIAVDVSNPAALAVLSDNAVGAVTDGPRRMFLLGSTLYIASGNGTQKMFIYDVSNPAAPSLTSTLFLTQPGIGNPINGLFVRGGVIYMVTGTGSEGAKNFVLYDVGGAFLSRSNLNSVGGLALVGLP